jgi:hypothetical protein
MCSIASEYFTQYQRQNPRSLGQICGGAGTPGAITCASLRKIGVSRSPTSCIRCCIERSQVCAAASGWQRKQPVQAVDSDFRQGLREQRCLHPTLSHHSHQ